MHNITLAFQMENSIKRPTLSAKEKLEKLLCLPIYSAFSSFFSLKVYLLSQLLYVKVT